MTAPDRPGDRDQQQAAEVPTSDEIAQSYLVAEDENGLHYDAAPEPPTALEWLRYTHAETLSARRIEEAVAAARQEGRAEEAARWQAKIEALATDYGARRDASYRFAEVARDLRALLDGEQR